MDKSTALQEAATSSDMEPVHGGEEQEGQVMAATGTTPTGASARGRLRVERGRAARSGGSRTGRGRDGSRTGRRNLGAAAAFLAPTLVLILLLRLVPTVTTLVQATRSGLPGSLKPPEYVGLEVFEKVFASAQFWSSVRQTLVFNLIVNPVQIVLALALAVLLTRGLPATGIWRTLIFLPAAVPMTGSSIVWGIALRPDGPVNGILEGLGLPAQPFLTSTDQVLFSIILIASWIGVGYWMMFLIAGINDIPASYYEAARIDGAGAIRTFFSITVPLLRRPLLFVLVADTVSNFVLFAPIQILTKGGPQGQSNFLMFDVFHKSYDLSDPYTASAELVVLLIIMIAIVAVQFRLLGKAEDQ